MLSKNDTRASFEAIALEHAKLRELLESLDQTLDQPQPSPATIAETIGELQMYLRTHFEHEEQGGYFHELIEDAPRLKTQVDELLTQHPTLLQLVEQMAAAASGETRAGWRQAIRAQFEDFLAQFIEHEHQENRLLQDGYAQDIGAED